jgi:hypothetical protein
MLKRLSIRFRLTAWYSLSLTVILGLVAVASYFAMRASMYRAVDVDLRYRITGVEDFLESKRSSSLKDLPDAIAENGTLGVLFRLFDDNGQLIYQSSPLTSHQVDTSAPSPSGATIVYRDVGEGWPVRLAAQRVMFRGQPVIVEVAQPLRFHYASLGQFATSLLICLPLLTQLRPRRHPCRSKRNSPAWRYMRGWRKRCPHKCQSNQMRRIWLQGLASTWSSVLSAMEFLERSRLRSRKANSRVHHTFSKAKA